METDVCSVRSEFHDFIWSPLAGDINWMETLQEVVQVLLQLILSPLAGDINWMETYFIEELEFMDESPLAGDINWMET